jgi:ribulose-phosphate 3-epimerase
MKRTFLAPSILSANIGRLAEEVREVEALGAEYIHVDIMDGRFVPNLTFGPLVVKAVRAATRAIVDCHLMIVEPDRYIADFANAGADIISVHAEATPHLQRTLHEIRAHGKQAGVVLNPHTPEDILRYVLDDVDLILVMSVNPGFGGQTFLRQVLPKVQALREMIDASGRDIRLEIDGGIDSDTAAAAAAAGAEVLVAGNAIFGQKDRRSAMEQIRAAAAGVAAAE